MERKSRIFLMIFVLAAFCISTSASSNSISIGDNIEINVAGEQELTGKYQVSNEGKINLPVVGSLKVEGLSEADAAAAIIKALQSVMYDPQVTLKILERDKFQISISGEVKQSGMLTMFVGDRLIQAIATAGYTESADLANVVIFRKDLRMVVDITKSLSGTDTASNLELMPGDSIIVSKLAGSQFVLMLGKIEKQGYIPFHAGLSINEAVALAGGLSATADSSKITIKSLEANTETTVDFSKPGQNEGKTDVVLHAGDTIIIPEREKSIFTVLGSVNRPGQYDMKDEVTLSNALALAGGYPKGSAIDRVAVLRSSSGKPEPLMFDLRKIMAGTVADPVLQPGDKVLVPDKKDKPNILQMIGSVSPLFWLFR